MRGPEESKPLDSDEEFQAYLDEILKEPMWEPNYEESFNRLQDVENRPHWLKNY